MSENLFSLNSSKTEFLIIGHSNLHSIILHGTFVSFLAKHLTFSDQISFLSKSCCSHIHDGMSSAVSILTLILKQPVTHRRESDPNALNMLALTAEKCL